jgi:hypothetical protein
MTWPAAYSDTTFTVSFYSIRGNLWRFIKAVIAADGWQEAYGIPSNVV